MSEVQVPETAEKGVGARMIFALSLAGLLSGLALVMVYELTLPRITANRKAALRRAVFKVVPGSKAMQKLVLKDGKMAVGDEEADEGPAIYAAYDDEGKFMGYAIPGQGAGFQDTIRLIYGYDPVGANVVGMEILESKETPGLGDKIYKDEAFLKNFEALVVKPEILVVKNGQKSKANEVDGITGATISAKAVVKIINAANGEWLSQLPETGKELPLLPKPKDENEKKGGG